MSVESADGMRDGEAQERGGRRRRSYGNRLVGVAAGRIPARRRPSDVCLPSRVPAGPGGRALRTGNGGSGTGGRPFASGPR